MTTDEIIKEVSKLAGIAENRLTIRPLLFDPETWKPTRDMLLDGKKINVSWSPEEALDAVALQGSQATDELIKVLASQLKEIGAKDE